MHAHFTIAGAAASSRARPPIPRHFDIFQNYEIRCDRRDALRDHLAGPAIGTIVQWGGTPIHHFRRLGFTQRACAHGPTFSRQSLLLPMNHLLCDEQVGR